ncbi:restriction endonuclease subunit S [Phenylobacterium sp.]|uniref:restriction endonuclease subunit S n=1 Tax=Phenylobacterium sp. TaxID=1871053 RepID=UPI0035B34AD4
MISGAARLGDVATLNPPTPRGLLGSDTEVAVVPMAAVSEQGSMRIQEYKPANEVSSGLSYFTDGDVLVAKITPCYENNKITQASIDRAHAFGSTEFHVLRPDQRRLDGRYLTHFLRQDRVRTSGVKRMTGSGGQRRVPRSFLEELEIPLPPLGEQRRIAAILDLVDGLRRRDNLVSVKAHSLWRSAFEVMIGDPAVNAMRWPMRTLGSISLIFSDGPFGSNLKSEHYVPLGVRVIRLQNIGVGEFIDNDRAYISAEHFSRLQKHACRPFDVLIGTLGDPNLRACLQPQAIPIALNKADCVQMRCDPDKALPEYVEALLNHPSTARMAASRIQGQTRLRISMGRLRELEVPVPPVSVQSEFVERVRNIRALQGKQTERSERLDALFASLQHRAFRGEL